MRHFNELGELVIGILNGLIELTIVAEERMGPRLGTFLVVIALLSALAFAGFSAKMFEDFALRALQEILTALTAALVWTIYPWHLAKKTLAWPTKNRRH